MCCRDDETTIGNHEMARSLRFLKYRCLLYSFFFSLLLHTIASYMQQFVLCVFHDIVSAVQEFSLCVRDNIACRAQQSSLCCLPDIACRVLSFSPCFAVSDSYCFLFFLSYLIPH